MWFIWAALLLITSVLGDETPRALGVNTATTRRPLRTLDREAAELAWRSWLQSPENGNQNAPARRITTKSLFVLPISCKDGQKLDKKECVEVFGVDKNEHEQMWLSHLNSNIDPSTYVSYDYGEADTEPLKVSIGPQVPPLQAEQKPQALQLQLSNTKYDKKDGTMSGDAIAAELELLKLQNAHDHKDTELNNNKLLLNNLLTLADKIKRDSSISNDDKIQTNTEKNNDEDTNLDKGQKEVIYGQINIDPVLELANATELLNAELIQSEEAAVGALESELEITSEPDLSTGTETTTFPPTEPISTTAVPTTTDVPQKPYEFVVETKVSNDQTNTETITKRRPPLEDLNNKNENAPKLNPENDYSDIGEAIKLISRYAEVTTDDSFSKNQKKYAGNDDILGTRTKLQHRKNKLKTQILKQPLPAQVSSETDNKDKGLSKSTQYYRYPWISSQENSPPPGYPYKHLQDYWPGKNPPGIYSSGHENPRRHHHSYNYFKARNGPYYAYLEPVRQDSLQYNGFGSRPLPYRNDASRYRDNNRDLYSLLGLRHWFSSEGTDNR